MGLGTQALGVLEPALGRAPGRREARVHRQSRGDGVNAIYLLVAVRRVLQPCTGERLHVGLEDLGDVDQNREAIHSPYAALDLREPRLRPADEAGQLSLAESAATAIDTDAVANWSVKRHVSHATRT